jgi:hypothetical protein
MQFLYSVTTVLYSFSTVWLQFSTVSLQCDYNACLHEQLYTLLTYSLHTAVLLQTGPGAHPASCTKGTGAFPGVKRQGRGADYPPSPSAEVENE